MKKKLFAFCIGLIFTLLLVGCKSSGFGDILEENGYTVNPLAENESTVSKSSSFNIGETPIEVTKSFDVDNSKFYAQFNTHSGDKTVLISIAIEYNTDYLTVSIIDMYDGGFNSETYIVENETVTLLEEKGNEIDIEIGEQLIVYFAKLGNTILDNEFEELNVSRSQFK